MDKQDRGAFDPKRRNHLRWMAAAFLAASLSLPIGAAADENGNWITTWSASVQPVWDADFFAPVGIPRSVFDQTIRQVGRVSLGGNRVRVVISNEYGKQPLVIGSAHVALAGSGVRIKAGSDRALSFSGKSGVTVPPGAPVVSDPVDLKVENLASLAVDLYFPEVSPTTTWHNDARQTAYISGPGDVGGSDSFKPQTTVTSRIFLSDILVDAERADRALVLFGDSITDGDGSSLDANRRWPDILAERLSEAGARIAVVNQGISGARVLRDRLGDNALARFDRDVLSQPRADTVVLMMGINDIGWPGTVLSPKDERPTLAEDVIAGYKQLIARAHDHGLRIIGATLTPFEETFEGTPLYGYYSEEKEAKRAAINDWIKTSGAFDGVIDFDAVMRDPQNARRIRAEFDKGDHLHPNDAGYRAMAESIDLGLFDIKP